jgi:hypothetical protein
MHPGLVQEIRYISHTRIIRCTSLLLLYGFDKPTSAIQTGTSHMVTPATQALFDIVYEFDYRYDNM